MRLTLKKLSSKVTVSIIVPAYNEDEILEQSIEDLLSIIGDKRESYEIIIVDNGSEDETPKIAEELATSHPTISWEKEPKSGRGVAVATGFHAAQGDILAFTDADLATDLRHLEELIQSIRTCGYDVATGSRWIRGKEADRPLDRTVFSRTYNLLVRVLAGSSLRDHQCGFKAFSRDVIEDILDDVNASHWFWDTEILLLAQYNEYRIKEFPVEWEPNMDTTVNFSHDVPKMALQLLGLTIRLRISSNA